MEQQEPNQNGGEAAFQVPVSQVRNNLVQAMERTGDTFKWIGGLSLLNTVLVLTKANVMMLGGLGVTLVVDFLFLNSGPQIQPIGWGINITIALMFFALAKFCGKGHRAAFMVGMLLYTLDTALFVLFSDWLNVAFHGYFLYLLYRGFKASGIIKQAIAELDQTIETASG